MQAAATARKTKAEVYLPPPRPATRVALRGDKGKHSCRNQSVAASASARKWIHVICPLPEGAELLMAGLSVLVEPLYPISALSQPIQLLLLIAFSHLPTSQPVCLFWRGHQLATMSFWGPTCPWPSSSAAGVCLSVCVRMNKQWRGGWRHCVCSGKGLFLTFAEQSAWKKGSWIPVGSERLYRRRRSGASQRSHQQSFRAPQSRG